MRLFVFAFYATSLFAQTPPAATASAQVRLAIRVDAMVAPFVAVRDFTGNVLVARNGRVLVRRSYGQASFEPNTPNVANTRFAIGSVSKTFTAAAIARLVEQKRLALADPARRYVPELTSDTTITIEHLLAHTSGVPDYYVLPEYASRYQEPMPLDSFARLVGAKPVDFKPGTRSNYSNSGYKLLGLVIERVAKVPYAEFVRREILVPLGLKDTGTLSATPVPKVATGYNPGFAPTLLQSATSVDRSWLEGAGSLYSTADDLLRWAEATRQRPAPRFGWGPRARFGNVASIEQSGRIPIGYTSYLAIYPDSGLVVVLLSNVHADVVERLGIAIAEVALNPNAKTPAPTATVTRAFSGDSLSRYAGRYEIAPGFALSVRNGADGLSLAGPDGIYLPLNSMADGRFFFRPLQVAIAFPQDAGGVVTALDWGGQFSGRRVR